AADTGGTSSRNRRQASASGAGNSPDDEAISWPSLTKVGPSARKADTTPSEADSASVVPPRIFRHGQATTASARWKASTSPTCPARTTSAQPSRPRAGTVTVRSSAPGPSAYGPAGTSAGSGRSSGWAVVICQALRLLGEVRLDAQYVQGGGQRVVLADQHHQLEGLATVVVGRQGLPGLIRDVAGLHQFVDRGQQRLLVRPPPGRVGAVHDALGHRVVDAHPPAQAQMMVELVLRTAQMRHPDDHRLGV